MTTTQIFNETPASWLYIRPELAPVTAESVAEKICSHFGITIKQLKSKSRSRNIVYPRFIVMLILHQQTQMTLKEIGQFFGRDHSTVIHGINSLYNRMDVEPSIRAEVIRLGGEYRGRIVKAYRQANGQKNFKRIA